MVSEAGWDWITQGPLAKMEERRWSSRTGSSLGEPVREQGAVVYATLRALWLDKGNSLRTQKYAPPGGGVRLGAEEGGWAGGGIWRGLRRNGWEQMFVGRHRGGIWVVAE